MGWFEKWSEKKRCMPNNYCTLAEFNKATDGFGGIANIRELNAKLTQVGELWDIATGKKHGYYYPSVDHPNFHELEQRIKAIETAGMGSDDFDCIVFSRGMAAITTVLEALGMNKDGVFIHGTIMYPQTKEVLADDGSGRNLVGSKPAIPVSLFDAGNLEKALHEVMVKDNINVLGVIFEPVANPTIQYSDVKQIAEICSKYDVPVIVDNTFLTPYLMQPFRMGADIVVHSLTKYINGEGDLIGGVAIVPKELGAKVRNERKVKGRTMSPYDAYRCAGRVGGLAERMERHCKNAKKLAAALQQIDGIAMNYSDLGAETRCGYAGGVLSFVFKGNERDAFARSLEFTHILCDDELSPVKQAVSFAEKRTLVLPWAGQVPNKDYLKKNNIPVGLVRVGVGRERNFGAVTDYIVNAINKSL